MFTTIAWATDGSVSASDALPIAEGLTRATGGKLVILHIQEITISRSGFLAEDNRAVLASLHRTARRLQDGGVHATVLTSRTTTRNVPRRILDLVHAAHADLLVIGNRGHGSVVNFLLGSVATRLLQAASLPIIAVPSRSTATTPLADGDIASIAARGGVQPAQPGQPLSHLRADSVTSLDTRPSGHRDPDDGHRRPQPARR
jgi:nucleotide-binding universal stress UspA family protein